MKIGPIHVEVPVLLAPMAAVTDLPFRTIVEDFGVGLTITEFLSAHAIVHGDNKTTDKMTPSLHGRRFGVQIFGREPEAMIIAARRAVDIGASLVDINMGCPAKRVVAGACGSALMKEPQLAQELVRAIAEAVPEHIPVTVKHRAGWDARHLNAPEFACAMVEAGAKMITVHGRTRTQGFSGHSSLDIIARVRQAVPAHIPVVGNGDVLDVEDYVRMRETTGCDAVMIGRGALGNPWLFRSIKALHEGAADPGVPSLQERHQVFRRHIELILELKGGPKLLHEVRKASAWYAKGQHGCNALRQSIWTMRAPEQVLEEVGSFFEKAIARKEQVAA